MEIVNESEKRRCGALSFQSPVLTTPRPLAVAGRIVANCADMHGAIRVLVTASGVRADVTFRTQAPFQYINVQAHARTIVSYTNKPAVHGRRVCVYNVMIYYTHYTRM